jgi:hypothetical protein
MSRIGAARGHQHRLQASAWTRRCWPYRPPRAKCESGLPFGIAAESGQGFARIRGSSELPLAINAFGQLIQRLHSQTE